MKELNLLPPEYRFDLEKYSLIKKLFYTIIFNLIILIIITLTFNVLIKKQKEQLRHALYVLKSLKQLNSQLIPYIDDYKILRQKITELKKKKNLYYIRYNVNDSPFLSFLILNETLEKGIEINNLNYSKGEFKIEGTADSNESFYNYFENLRKNKYIKDVEFSYLKKDKMNNLLNFSLKIKIRELHDELFVQN